jgi:hypothetical protein
VHACSSLYTITDTGQEQVLKSFQGHLESSIEFIKDFDFKKKFVQILWQPPVSVIQIKSSQYCFIVTVAMGITLLGNTRLYLMVTIKFCVIFILVLKYSSDQQGVHLEYNSC